jgi:hypothetical protein
MIISLALALLCTAGGTIATYLYDEGASFSYRVCSGACVGLAALGLICFVIASFLGLSPLTIAISLVVVWIVPFVVLQKQYLRKTIRQDLQKTSQGIRQTLLHPTRITGTAVFYVLVVIVLWRVFGRAVIEEPEGLFTGVLNNFGDLPFHISVITSFVYGENFPPEDPTYAGVKFTYPFLTDFISAIFVRCGANLRESMFVGNMFVAVSFVGLVHRWALVLLRDRLAALLTPLIVLLSGGLGWTLLWSQAEKHQWALFATLRDLPPSFTVIPETTWRWGNAISTLLIPQRGILLGLALAVIVFTQWWLSEVEPPKHTVVKQRKKQNPKRSKVAPDESTRSVASTASFSFPFTLPIMRMIAAGVVAGLLPLVHAHSFVVVMVMGACIALLRRRWREWFVFFVVASVVALPQMLWSTIGSAVDASTFFEWHLGWDRREDSVLWFWFKNTGFFIPLLMAALLWRGNEYLVKKRLLLFYLPFTLCFIIPNVMKMAPWVWDNIKVIYYWWLASAPLVALLLARLWRQGKWWRPLAVLLLIVVTLSGALDVAAIALRSTQYQVFDRNGLLFAELIKENTEPRALVIHAPVHNHPIFLTGRRSLLGYPGHIWTHGLDFAQRESEIKQIYAGSADAAKLLRDYQIDYLIVGPLERNNLSVNDRFMSKLQKVGEVGAYQLYKVKTP